MLSAGQVIDRYTIESIIGSGGTAVVYLVQHNSLATRHALKVLSITSAAIRERMLREGRVQASLRHPNVVAVTDVLDVDGSPGLLMEYIEGPSLDAALMKYRLTVSDAETLFLGIVAGVRHAHHGGLVHRDLKPANVLLAPTQDGYVPKVTDFGLAKVLVGEDHSVGNTRSGIAMGTPSYMAPEQVRDARAVDQRADVFSLGCILYELVTGHRTFPGDDAILIYNHVTSGTYEKPTEHVADLPFRIVNAIQGALLVDREHRIPDCTTLLRVLVGDEEWDTDVAPPTEEIRVPLRLGHNPNSLPPMQVAARSPSNPATTPPAPSDPGPRQNVRNSGGGAGLALVEAPPTTPEPENPYDEYVAPIGHEPVGSFGTLGGDESLEMRRPRGRKPVAIIAGVLIGLLLVATLALGVVGIAATVILGGSVWRGSAATTPAESIEKTVPSKVTTPPVQPPVLAPAVTPAETASETAAESKALVEPTPSETKAAPVEPTPAETKATTVSPTESKATSTKSSTTTKTSTTKSTPTPAVQVEVRILSSPANASVKVDGLDLGRTPRKTMLSAGSHKVEIQSGEQTATFTIKPTSGGENKWCYSFAEARSLAGSCPLP